MRLNSSWLLFFCVVISACGVEALPPLVTSDVNITTPVSGKSMSAGYLSITNNTDELISISRVESSQFESVQLHESVIEDGIAKMHRLNDLSIPANSTIKLEPSGKHLMLMRRSDTSRQISLRFYSEEALLLRVIAPLKKRIN